MRGDLAGASGVLARRRLLGAALAIALLAIGADAAQAATYEVVFPFNGTTNGDGPMTPKLGVDLAGSTYGTTDVGGSGGCGTVWRLQPPLNGTPGIFSVLHAFSYQEAGPVQFFDLARP